MIPNILQTTKSNPFTTPPPKKFTSPKSITRKPSFINFTKKKPTEISQIKSSDRIRFISPQKANLFLNQECSLIQDSFNSIKQINYTQFSQNQPINYPFIKKCVSPKHFNNLGKCRKYNSFNFQIDNISNIDNGSQGNITNRQNQLQQSLNSISKQLKTKYQSFLPSNLILSPSIQDFNQLVILNEISPTKQINQLQQQISELKKQNFQLTLQIEQKTQQLEKQDIENKKKISQMQSLVLQIRQQVSIRENKEKQQSQRLQKEQKKYKQIQQKYLQTGQKLQKAIKQIKMYKAKYKTGITSTTNMSNISSISNIISNSSTTNKKYHQNCCRNHNNEQHTHQHHNSITNISSNNKMLTKCSNSNNNIALNESKNKHPNIIISHNNQQNPTQTLASLTSNNGQQNINTSINTNTNVTTNTNINKLKKIKSQTTLPTCTNLTSLSTSPQASRLMKIHHNQEEFFEYSSLKHQIQYLANQMRYKDIEILTLKKYRSDFEKQKQGNQKLKKFNKKLLARVEFLTKQCDDMQHFPHDRNTKHNSAKRLSLPLTITPHKKKFKRCYENFEQDQQQQYQERDQQSQQIALFELSPQKQFDFDFIDQRRLNQRSRLSFQTTKHNILMDAIVQVDAYEQ